MPNVAVNSADISPVDNTTHDFLRQLDWEPWCRLNYLTWAKEEPVILPYMNMVGLDEVQCMYLPDTSPADSFARLSYISDLGSTGDFILDDVGNLTGCRDQINGILRDYFVQVLMVGIANKETGLEEQLLAEFRDSRERSSIQLSERLQGFIYRYENYGHSSEQIPQGTRVAIRNLFAWLSQRDPDMFATVTEDGLLVLEATLDSKGQLFVEIDRDGTVEATFASSGLDIIGLNVTNISELTYDLVSSIGGS